jgi:hypothetical protein
MALRPIAIQPTRTNNSDPTGYPHGKAQDVTTPGLAGTNDGTAWTAALINEIFGFLQGLLGQAGITPNNLAEKANASQYVDAVKALGKDQTRYTYSANNGTAISLGDANHGEWIDCTASGAITLTFSAPAAPYGKVITVERAGTGNITAAGAVTGATVLNTAGKVASFISKPGTWKMLT